MSAHAVNKIWMGAVDETSNLIAVALITCLIIKTHDSESRGQEEAAVRDE